MPQPKKPAPLGPKPTIPDEATPWDVGLIRTKRQRQLEDHREATRDHADAQVPIDDEDRTAVAAQLGLTPEAANEIQTRHDLREVNMRARRQKRDMELRVGEISSRYAPQMRRSGWDRDMLKAAYQAGESQGFGGGRAAMNLRRIDFQNEQKERAQQIINDQAADAQLARFYGVPRVTGLQARSYKDSSSWEDRLAAATLTSPEVAARAAVMPDAPGPADPEDVAQRVKDALNLAQTMPAHMREAFLASTFEGMDPEQVARTAAGMNKADGKQDRSLLSDILDAAVLGMRGLFAPPPKPAAPPQASRANPAGPATGYTDPRSMAYGRNAGSILSGLMG